MAEDPHTPVEVPIPESLRRQLDGFRRQLWRTKIAEAVLAGICGLLFSFLLVFALDRVWPTPALLRLVILAGGTSLAAVFAPWWLHRWVWRHRRENQLAHLIAKRFPGLGDRLLGVVELQQQVEDADTLSPRLRAAAMERVAEEARRRELTAALPASRHRRWLLALAAGLLVAATAFTLVPKAGFSSLKRWLMPLSETPRYTFTALSELPDSITVPQGEAFPLVVRLAADSDWQPATGSARYGRQDPVDAVLADGAYRFDFPAQQEPGVIRLEIGDARHAITVTPTLRPAIQRVFARVTHPAYLQLPDREVDLGSGVLSTVRGSGIAVTAEATRALATAAYGPLRAKDLTLAEGGPMTINGASASTPPLEVSGPGFALPIEWTDTLGLSGEKGFEVRVDALEDEAPGIYLQGMPRQHVMLAEETVDFEVLAEDDFGVRRIGLEWSGEVTRATDEAPAKGELKLLDGGPAMNRLAGPAAFSPAAVGITPQKLILRAWSEDYLPDRARSYSEPVTLFVLTRDEHAQMLKTRFDRAISELEDLARRERGLFEENQRLEKLAPKDLQTEETRKRLEAQQEGEAQQTERMKELSKTLEQLFKDSTRNGSIDKETLKKMAEARGAMKELADKEMPEVDDKLGEARDEKNTEEKAAEDMRKAVQEQREVVEKMREAIEKANDANQRFEAGTFVNRLKKAASDEQGIGTAVWESYERTAGAFLADLDPSDLGKLEDTIRQQANTASDVRWIQEDLGHFHARTNKEEYRKILDAMVESRIDLELEDLRRLLEMNHGYRGKEEAERWAAKLNEWAKLLEGAQQGGGGAGGGGGASPEQDEDFEFMLRMMKLIQQEQDLRARTRALEILRRSYEPAPPAKP